MKSRIFRAVCLVSLWVLLAVTAFLIGIFYSFIPDKSVFGEVAESIATMVIITFLCVLASALYLSKKIVEPLKKLNPDEPIFGEGYEEVEHLVHRIETEQKQIRLQKTKLLQQKKEFAAVIDKMSEGLILLSVTGEVISINRAASFLLEISSACDGESIADICRLPDMHILVAEAKNGRRAEQLVNLRGGKYKFSATPVISIDEIIGILLLITNVTENVDAERLRREFTANVSHELKTPLQTISGCAELLANGIVKAEDVPQFSRQIYTEAQRMIALVQDIISLSHLDEGATDMQSEDFDLYAVCAEVVNGLKNEAKTASVALDISGESVTVHGIRRLASVIVQNLCDNAIKYNRENGNVRVRVFKENGFAVLHVADTGIGIPKDDCERIFERFYRVDKSRSKTVGGTGLGLSIVKHAAELNGAAIKLESEVGRGTAVTVKFPMK